ncbi:hypothetical protein M409DRAFT_29719 [Zasmidium cellare ATCC 36951]|uniref:Uncharacterized protein n=1 Tax=Zasmidium cellare ATCC 36951 TaxID=1080233 RepID=A0A6A6C2G0_ZASCE|nr:uncharacterized protein M409DRAFT_29719 [Zasmidium cellare ATCC 36951]KAF2159909.1 hypothetical protein M409DRAFT_29719 [Zasmidium cellare ATCC 36951]
MNFPTYLQQNGPEDVESPLFIDADNPERSLSWRQYASTVKQIAVGLRDIGVEQSDTVAIVSRNDIFYYILGNGINAAGGVFSPVSAFAKPIEMEHQLRVTYAKWVFVEPEFLDEVVAAAEKVGTPKSNILVFDMQDQTRREGYQTFSQILQADESKYTPLDFDSKQPCDRYLTSGSTGLPKAAEMSHGAMISRVRPYLALPNPKPLSSVRNLHFIDMHHISGWFNNTFTAIGKHTYYVLRRTDALSIVDTITRHRITHIMMHPRMVEEVVVLLQQGVRERSAISSLELVRVAGSVVRGDFLDLLERFMAPSGKANISYGATEMSTIAATLWGTPRLPGCVGKPPVGVELLIVDPDTLEELPHDVDGEICCRSPGMFTGYVNNEEATKKALVQISSKTWLRTGDRGHWSSSLQQLAITGRYKETFKVGTEEVAPEEVEVELLKQPGISDVALTSTDARPGKGGLEPLAYIVAPDKSISAQQIVDHIADCVAAYKAPTGGVVFCESIPRTSFGKIQRAKLNGLMEKVSWEERSARFLTPTTDMSHL